VLFQIVLLAATIHPSARRGSSIPLHHWWPAFIASICITSLRVYDVYVSCLAITTTLRQGKH
jgi:hypothetical protein